jgi:hypothetical protein
MPTAYSFLDVEVGEKSQVLKAPKKIGALKKYISFGEFTL